jgi:hypothetical protein
MCEHLGIDVRVGRRILKKLGVIRTPEIIAKFRGHKNHNEEWDNYFKANYLIKPLAHICKHLGISVKCGTLIMKRLELKRPKYLALRFQGIHRGINDPAPVKKKYYTPVVKSEKPVKKKGKTTPILKLQKEKTEKKTTFLPNKVIDYSQKVMVRIDNKTWVYRDKTA